MQMMYGMIYNALKEAGLENKYEPQDYLNFFCLGNREASDGESPIVTSPAPNTPQVIIFLLRIVNLTLSLIHVLMQSYLTVISPCRHSR